MYYKYLGFIDCCSSVIHSILHPL